MLLTLSYLALFPLKLLSLGEASTPVTDFNGKCIVNKLKAELRVATLLFYPVVCSLK